MSEPTVDGAWVKHLDEETDAYYWYNSETEESRWCDDTSEDNTPTDEKTEETNLPEDTLNTGDIQNLTIEEKEPDSVPVSTNESTPVSTNESTPVSTTVSSAVSSPVSSPVSTPVSTPTLDVPADRAVTVYVNGLKYLTSPMMASMRESGFVKHLPQGPLVRRLKKVWVIFVSVPALGLLFLTSQPIVVCDVCIILRLWTQTLPRI